jgi:hypothetical protein
MRQIVNDLFQARIRLPNDLVELCGLHSGVLQLLEGASGFDTLVLSGVADHDDPVVRFKTVEELTSLPRADEARLVHHIEVRRPSVVRGSLGQVTLKRGRRNSRLL